MEIKRFRLFGWYIAVSKEPFKTNKRDPKRNRCRDMARNERLRLAGNKCEICGRDIDITCSVHHILPVGAENRNKVENLRVLCCHCKHELDKNPHYHGIRHMEDESRYDGNTPTI